MKKQICILLLAALFLPFNLNAQRGTPDPNIQLPIDEKIALYFETYGDGQYTQGASNFADAIAFEFQTDVIPYMKEYLQGADYFGYVGEPKDVRLELISYVLSSLHTYTNPVFADVVDPYTLEHDVIQWFVDEYKSRLEAYINTVKQIDSVVMMGESHLGRITRYSGNFGHPDFEQDGRFNVYEIKSYYEQRLGIDDLPFDLPQRRFDVLE